MLSNENGTLFRLLSRKCYIHGKGFQFSNLTQIFSKLKALLTKINVWLVTFQLYVLSSCCGGTLYGSYD